MAKGRKGGVDGGHRSDSQGHKRDVDAHIHGKTKAHLSDLDAAKVDLEVSKHEGELGVAAEKVTEAGAKLKEAREKEDNAEGIARAERDFQEAVTLYAQAHKIAETFLRDRALTPVQRAKIEESLTQAQVATKGTAVAAGRKTLEPALKLEQVSDRSGAPEKRPRKMKAIDASNESMDKALSALKEKKVTDLAHHPLVEALARRRDTYLALQEARKSRDLDEIQTAETKDIGANATLKNRARQYGKEAEVNDAWQDIKNEIKLVEGDGAKVKKERGAETSLAAVDLSQIQIEKDYLQERNITNPAVIQAFVDMREKYQDLQDFYLEHDAPKGDPNGATHQPGFKEKARAYQMAQEKYKRLCEGAGINYRDVAKPAWEHVRDRIDQKMGPEFALVRQKKLQSKAPHLSNELEALRNRGINNDLALAQALKECKEAYCASIEARKGDDTTKIIQAEAELVNKRRVLMREAGDDRRDVVRSVWEDFVLGEVRAERRGISQESLDRAGLVLARHGITSEASRTALAGFIEAHEAIHFRPSNVTKEELVQLQNNYRTAGRSLENSLGGVKLSDANGITRKIADEIQKQTQKEVAKRIRETGWIEGEGVAATRAEKLLNEHGVSVEGQEIKNRLVQVIEAYDEIHLTSREGNVPRPISSRYQYARDMFEEHCRRNGIPDEVAEKVLKGVKDQMEREKRRRISSVGAAVAGAVALGVLAVSEGEAGAQDENYGLAVRAINDTLGLAAGDEDLVGALARLKKTSDKLGEARLAYNQVQGLWGKGVLEGENVKAYVAAQSAVTEAQEQYRKARNHFNEVCKSKGINGLQAEIIWDRMQGKYYTQQEMGLAKAARDKALAECQQAAGAVPEAIKAAGKIKEDPNATDAQKAQAEAAVRAAVAKAAQKTKAYWVINSRYERMAGVMKVSLPAAKLPEETKAQERTRAKADQVEPSARALAQYTDAQLRAAKEIQPVVDAAVVEVAAAVIPGAIPAQMAVVAMARGRVQEAEALNEEARDAWVREQVKNEFEKVLAKLPAEEAERIRRSPTYLEDVEESVQGVKDYWAGDGAGSTDVMGGSLFTSLDGSGKVDEAQDIAELPEFIGTVSDHATTITGRVATTRGHHERRRQAEADVKWSAETRFGIERKVRDDIEIAETATGRYPGMEGVVIPYQTQTPNPPRDNRVAEAEGKKEMGKPKNRETVWAAAAGENYTPDVSMSPNMDACVEGGEYQSAMSIEEQLSSQTPTQKASIPSY
ncbi:MAG: hypothetical protein K1X66_03055 [Verrucomicrobiae bacterium]|nr:hypothetical protein [Verrucomicrobiae bacterium]